MRCLVARLQKKKSLIKMSLITITSQKPGSSKERRAPAVSRQAGCGVLYQQQHDGGSVQPEDRFGGDRGAEYGGVRAAAAAARRGRH